MDKIDNPQAFPSTNGTPSDQWGFDREGMTLRDYFAGQALISYIASVENITTKTLEKSTSKEIVEKLESLSEYIPKQCYRIADVMLKERNK